MKNNKLLCCCDFHRAKQQIATYKEQSTNRRSNNTTRVSPGRSATVLRRNFHGGATVCAARGPPSQTHVQLSKTRFSFAFLRSRKRKQETQPRSFVFVLCSFTRHKCAAYGSSGQSPEFSFSFKRMSSARL